MTNEGKALLSIALLAMTAAGAGGQQPSAWEPPVFAWYTQHHPEIAAAAAMKAAAAQKAGQMAPANIPALAPGTYATFDAPGAVSGSFYAGTKPVAINGAGSITGSYQDASFVTHGFIRTPDGSITTFDVPGDTYGTYPEGIDEAGDVAGYYCDSNDVCHGFWYAAAGEITAFDVPGAVGGTYALAMDSGGTVTGYYWDKSYYAHGFVRTAAGKIQTFSAPGAANGTYALAVSSSGAAGAYEDANYVLHGFLATASGMASFDPPGSLQISEGIYSFAPGVSINREGMVAGYYSDPQGQPELGAVRGFIRNQDGSFTTFDAGPLTACCLWTMPYAINDYGAVTGSINGDDDVNHGFVRAVDGAITWLDVPGAGTAGLQGTASLSINSKGVATGVYIDSSSAFHGFVYYP